LDHLLTNFHAAFDAFLNPFFFQDPDFVMYFPLTFLNAFEYALLDEDAFLFGLSWLTGDAWLT